MLKQWIARLTHDDNPRLHRIPFLVIWIAGFGLAFFSSFMLTLFLSDLDGMVYDHLALMGLLVGAAFGSTLALIQGWAMRRRYGFVPRFWRAATIIGMTIATGFFFSTLNNSYSDTVFLQASGIWMMIWAISQASVLFRLHRQSPLLIAIGGLATVVGAFFIVFDIGNYDSEIWALLFGSMIQAIGSGIVILRLLANPREGAVPKRQEDLKAKGRNANGLHPFTFISFWMGAYFMGWVMLMVCMAVWFLTIGDTRPINQITGWINQNAEWINGVTMGTIIGIVISIGQKWLMKQRGLSQIKGWIGLSTLGWALGGIGFFVYVDNYNITSFESSIALMTWFTAPALFQTIPMWRNLRGGWMWVATGLATGIVAITINQQFAWSYNDTLYTLMLGGIAQAIITGATFILLQSQQNRSTASPVPDAT